MFGLGRQKPHHYREMLKIAWENRDELPFAWRILNDGVCDGCALGTSGLSDWTIEGTHLCMVRLELMRLNTAPALDPSALADVSTIASRSSQDLRALGRLPEPMLRRKGDRGFRVVSWDEALDRIAVELRAVDTGRAAFAIAWRSNPPRREGQTSPCGSSARATAFARSGNLDSESPNHRKALGRRAAALARCEFDVRCVRPRQLLHLSLPVLGVGVLG